MLEVDAVQVAAVPVRRGCALEALEWAGDSEVGSCVMDRHVPFKLLVLLVRVWVGLPGPVWACCDCCCC